MVPRFSHILESLLHVTFIAALVLAGGCADEAVTHCGAGVCPAGTECDETSGLCVAQPPPQTQAPSPGAQVSLARTRDGVVLMATYDTAVRGVFLTETGAGAEPVSSLVDDGGGPAIDVGSSLSLALDKSDEPTVAYYDRTSGDLRLAFRKNASWRVAVVDGTEGTDVGRSPSVIVDGLGRPHMVYRDDTGRRLRFLSLAEHGCRVQGSAPCDAEMVAAGQCTPEPRVLTPEIMAAAGMPSTDFGLWPSIAITGEHALVASFYDVSRGNLVMARCDGGDLSLTIIDGEDPETGADTGDVGLWSSVAVDPNGDASVAYYDRTGGVLKFAGSFQGELQVVVVDDGSGCDGGAPGSHVVGQGASLDIFEKDSVGLARIAYIDATDRSVLMASLTGFGGWECAAVARWPDALGAGGSEVDAASAHVGGLGLGLDLVAGPSGEVTVAYGWWVAEAAGPKMGVNVQQMPGAVRESP